MPIAQHNQNRFAKVAALLCALLFPARAALAVDIQGQIEQLRSTSALDQNHAVEQLLQSSAAAVVPLLDAFEGFAEMGQYSTLVVFDEIPLSDRGVRQLSKTVQKQRRLPVLARFAGLLRKIGSSVAVEELKAIAKSREIDEGSRGLATGYVGQLAAATEREFLVEQTKDSSRLVRLEAWQALAFYQGERAGRSEALDVLRNASSFEERKRAISILGSIADKADRALLQGLRDTAGEAGIRFAAFRALRHFDLAGLSSDAQSDALEKAVGDPDRKVREWAKTELWLRHDDKARSIIARGLKARGGAGKRELQELAHALNIHN